MKNEKITLLNKDGEAIEARYVKIIKVIEYVDEDYMKLELELDDFFGRTKVITIFPSQICRNQLLRLTNQGLDATEANVDLLVDYLQKQLYSEKREYEHLRIHKQLGFFYEDNETNLCFKHFNVLNKDGILPEERNSTYEGCLDIKPSGSFEKYKDFLQNEIKDNIYLQMICSISLTAPILWMISNNSIEVENYVVNITGNSSTGKSTALALAMSLWGNAKTTSSTNSMIKTWHATKNALIKEMSLMGYQGIPFAIDELGLSNIKDFTDFVYSIASGTDKKKLTSTSELMENQGFKTIVISTGELGMRENMKTNTAGSKVIRLIEFSNLPWTKNAEQANRIKGFISKNYGTFAPEFVQYLLRENIFSINKFDEHRSKFEEELKKKIGTLGERLAMKFGMISLTHQILMGFLGLENEYDFSEIREILLSTLDDYEDEGDLARKAYEAIMTDFTENQRLYCSSSKELIARYSHYMDSTPNRVYGKYNAKEIAVTRKHFEQIMRQNGFKNVKAILNEWIDKDIIIPENMGKGRITPYNRRTIVGNAPKIASIVFKADNIYEDPKIEEEEKRIEINSFKHHIPKKKEDIMEFLEISIENNDDEVSFE